ncbi:sulfotransferase [Haloferula helveola]|uniref:Sulfotransferase n=2 Tax=Haloferula helveola TaxID=490095 RepID=A0ABM7RJH8_9BACT|nr:sulfotransferase [Haloferula helveola]
MKNERKPKPGLAYNALRLREHEFQVAWASRDLDKCVEVLEKVLVLNPRSTNAYFQLARVYGLRYQHDDAIRVLDEAVRRSPKEQRVLALAEAGKTAKEFFDPSVAAEFLKRAVEAAAASRGRHALDDLADAKLALAEHFRFTRCKAEAAELVEQVLEDLPHDKSARLLWCKLNESDVENCLDELNDLMDGAEGEFRVKVAYQLGKMRDKAGDFAGAMEALIEAKQPMMGVRDALVSNRIKVRAQLSDFIREFDRKKLDEWNAAAGGLGEPKRIALLGGHPRSGTTLLEQSLDAHSDAVSIEETENFSVCFYCKVMKGLPARASIVDAMDACEPENLVSYRQGYLDAAERCLQEKVGDRLLIDKNPSLTFLAPSFLRLFPEAKLLVMLRDPRDVVLSCFMQAFFPPDLVTGNFLTLTDAAAEVNHLLMAWAELREHLQETLCEIRYEDLVSDLKGNVKRSLGFLGLGWSDDVVNFDKHAGQRVVRSPSADAVTEKVHRKAAGRWENYQDYLGPAIEVLSPSLKALGYA